MFEPGDLRFAVGGDDDDGIHALMGAGFKQERHFVHDDGMRSAFGDTANETLLFTRYPRMDDALELSKLPSIMEDDRPECMTVDGPVLVQHPLAEYLRDLAPSRLAPPHDVSGQLIGINDDCTAALEHLRHRAFPSRDSSG